MHVRLHVKRPKRQPDAYFIVPVRVLTGMENRREMKPVALCVVYRSSDILGFYLPISFKAFSANRSAVNPNFSNKTL